LDYISLNDYCGLTSAPNDIKKIVTPCHCTAPF
jgi:hypothetical protein